MWKFSEIKDTKLGTLHQGLAMQSGNKAAGPALLSNPGSKPNINYVSLKYVQNICINFQISTLQLDLQVLTWVQFRFMVVIMYFGDKYNKNIMSSKERRYYNCCLLMQK